MEILADTSPELAIKIAYDFARHLRSKEARDGDITALLKKWVDGPFRNNPLHRYITAGFLAGYNSHSLPWKRQIDEQASGQSQRPQSGP